MSLSAVPRTYRVRDVPADGQPPGVPVLLPRGIATVRRLDGRVAQGAA